MTGGSVDKIEVYQNEGGVTNFRGGFRPCIVPAGYVGVSFWGGVFVALSGGRIPATVAASFFCFALLICLRYVLEESVTPWVVGFRVGSLLGCLDLDIYPSDASLFFTNSFDCNHSYSPNRLLVTLCLSFIVITLGVLLLDWFVFDPLIQYLTLLYGTFIGWYGIMDIWYVVPVASLVFFFWLSSCHVVR